ncbi:uncharacterized protein LOC123866715 [Maniola jurtina]|uniref:uncharacterized protein LOC123866715 n=1 Tax=Maniola jurtina TaxID=191418 RepID=UPI001E6884B5|nr:uncharacterized protein LOC123866715 [Maniola jurtina]
MAKRGHYYKWNEGSMKLALLALSKKEAGLNEASRIFGVPKATLKRRFDSKNVKAKGEKQIVGSEGDLTPDLEKKLVNHILEMERCLYGIIPTDVRSLAFKIAEKNGLKHRFNKEKEMAGKKWYYGFLKRHPEISLRQPRATSFNRATAFNKPTVNDFFEKLERVMDEHGINDPRNIFNVDETGLSTVQRKPRKILAQRGKHQVGAITSGERGTTTTAVCCASASGNFIPPLIIFKRKRAKDELQDGAPPGSIFAFNPDSGYINKEIFFVWIQHFVETVKPSPEKKVLLILDGHTSHTKNLEAIEYAKNHNVVLLSLPAHTSNKLQPLDTSFFRPLSYYFIDETEKWLRSNPGRCVTAFQISMLFGRAYARAASVGNAVSGFEKCGIWPLNKDIFQDYEFITTTDDHNNEVQSNDENMDVDPFYLIPDATRTTNTIRLMEQNPGPSQNHPDLSHSSESHSQNALQLIASDVHSAEHTAHDRNNQSILSTSSEVPITGESLGANKAIQGLRQVRRRQIQCSLEEQTCPDMGTSSENQTENELQPLVSATHSDSEIHALTDQSVSTATTSRPEPSKQPGPSTSSDFQIASISPCAKKVIQELRKRSRKPQRALELTSSPYKRELEAAKNKAKSKATNFKQKTKKVKAVKDVPQEELEKWFCKICVLCSIEDMIQCLVCKCWVHEECACVKKGIKKYFCPSCR